MGRDVIFTTLGTTAIGVSAVAWLTKKLIGQFLEKDIERFKISIRTEGEKEIESLKASLHLEAQKQIVRFGAIHVRRAEIIAEFYIKLTEVQRLSQALPWSIILREYKEQYGKTQFHGLEPSEEEGIQKLSTAWREMSEFYQKRKIYFSAPVCDQIDRIQTITGFISVNYHNVACKDDHGEIYVNPEVKRVWDASHEALPKATAQLETEFRTLLGVNL